MARRLVAAALVVVSLALLTVYLRESEEGALHGAQRLGLAVLTPFQVAGERIARPFQDAYGVRLRPRRREVGRDDLEAEIQALRDELILYRTAAQENQSLRETLAFVDGPTLPRGLHGRHDQGDRPAADPV